MSNPSPPLRWKHDLDPAVLRCDPQTAAAIRERVRTWPRLTEQQKAALAALLTPTPNGAVHRRSGGDEA